MANDTMHFSPVLNDSQLPTDGVPTVQPKETLPADTYSSPVIQDRDLSFIEDKSKSSSGSSGSGDQLYNGVIKIGTAITIDGTNKHIIVNDGTHDRIIIGFYP